MFRTVPLSIIRSFSLYTQHGLLTACEQDQDGTNTMLSLLITMSVFNIKTIK